MIDYIIQTFKLNNIPIYVPGPGNVKDLLNWNASYRSFSADDYGSINSYPEIVYQFPYNPILLKQYKILTNHDVFPVEWTISISNDGDNYTIIDHQYKASCNTENQHVIADNPRQIGCSVFQLNTFSIDQKAYYAKYIKFSLLNNSFYQEDSLWRFLIHINGLDFDGLTSISTNLVYMTFRLKLWSLSFILL